MAEGLSILNANPKRCPGPDLLHHLVARESSRELGAIEYLSSEGSTECISYEELHRKADLLASKLRASCSAGEHFIAPIFIPQCPDLYVSELAALKAGAAFCPISTDVPEERLRFILRDVDARVLLTTTSFKSRLPALQEISIITVNDFDPVTDVEDSPKEVDPSRPAYIMYTSGSTGQPKGVILSHSAATQALVAHDRHIPSFNRFLQFASPTFDVSVFEIFFPLFRGCTIVTGDRRTMLNNLPYFITHLNIDAAELTPSVASSLLQGRESVPTLKCLLTIGEMLKQDVIEKFGGSSDEDGILHGMYGPTEATIHCTLQTNFSRDMSAGNIGIPLDTVSAFVINSSQNSGAEAQQIEILPIGEEGELAVGGYQLANAYLNRPKETNDAFVCHPEYGMLYRTGDRARLTQSGTIECLGRISHGQVKLRGQRIELGEVEYASSRTPQIVSVVAEVIENALITFCVCKANVSESEVRETCHIWLPAFMVPTEVIMLEDLPYLDSGKVNRKALQAIYAERKQVVAELNGQDFPRVNRLLEIVSEVLKIPISGNPSLVALGIDSLSAIRLAAQLRREGFPRLDATSLLDLRDVYGLERILTNAEEAEGAEFQEQNASKISTRLRDAVFHDSALVEQLHDIDEILVPTSVQLAMLSETAKDSQAYCNSIELHISGYGIEEVHSALLDLAKHHSLIRSGFVPVDGDEAPYALIVWKSLQDAQIRRTSLFGPQFQIKTSSDLLRPCKFQLLKVNDGTSILLQIHHALYDQWSVDLLKSDLTTLLLGHKLPMRPSFQAISEYQLATQSSASSDENLEFWQDVLKNFRPTAVPLMNGKKLGRNLERTSWRELTSNLGLMRDQSRTLGVGTHVPFQAAMAYLLGCFTSSTDITYGVVFSGRHVPVDGIESIFGPCLTTLPLRVDFSTTKTCHDLLRTIHQRNRDLQKRALTPLSEILQSELPTTGTRLFSSLLVWQETSLESVDTSVVSEVESVDHHEFDLVVELQPSEHGVAAKATYQQALMTLQQVEILLQQVASVVKEILHHPESLVQELALTLPDELLSISNSMPSACATECNLLGAVDEYAVKIPRSAAINFAKSIVGDDAEVEIVTWSELNARANRMANLLASFDVLPDDLVCICMDKSIDMYVAILAAFKVGAGYVPLTPETPPARIRSILEQSRIKICLCDANTTQTFHDLQAPQVIDITQLNLTHWGTDPPKPVASGSNVAYVVFTSGSTGEPKGVAVTRENLLGNLEALRELYNVEAGDRLLQACSQAFDVSVFEIFFAFYTGMCLCSAKPSDVFHDIEATIRAFKITHLSLTPTVAALINPDNVPGVRFLVTAGEGVTDLVHQRWAGRGLHQGYGPSETTNICTVNMNMSRNDVITNIGKLFRNTSAFVISMDSEFDILPAGSLGEYAFGGEQVFRGYVGRDDLNSKQIIDHPKFGRLYKSGDVGRILSDGTLLITGRLDGQVKIRGNRVELGEIISVLLEDPTVHDCTALLVQHDDGEQSLAAFVVPKDAKISISDPGELSILSPGQIAHLFDRLTDSIPQYMIPDIILPIKKLPSTSQGKLDKRCLKRLLESLSNEARQAFSRGADDSDDQKDWTDQERQIAQALRDCLRIPEADIERNQSFFSVGLNSLNAMQFAKLLSTRLERRVEIPMILQSFTIARLSRALNKQSSRGAKTEVASTELLPSSLVDSVLRSLPSAESEVECVLPCTPLQTAMLSAASSGHSSAYCNSSQLRVIVRLDDLKRSWKLMVSRHPILRTYFVETSDRNHPFVQIVQKTATLPWRDRHGNDSERQAGAVIVDATHPFSIQLQRSGQETILELYMHHAIYDGISMSRLLEEVELAYRDCELPAVPSFRRFLVESQRQAGPDALRYWSKQLEGYLPRPFPAAHSKSTQDRQIETRITASPAAVNSHCKEHAISHLAVFQAALARVLSCCQKVQDICFGNVVSGRTVAVEEVESLVAPCFNTIPIRVNLADTSTGLELAQQLSRSNRSMLRYQLTPLRRIQAFSMSPSSRLYDTLLIFQPPAHQLDHEIWELEAESGSMGIPLVFEVTPTLDGYILVLHYSEKYISSTLAAELSRAFDAAILSCVEHPHLPLDHFDTFDKNAISGRLETISDSNSSQQDANIVPEQPWTVEESAVRTSFASLADVQERDIRKNTSIFQLGLDSLNAPQIAHRLRNMGFDVDAADVMEMPTPSSLATVIKEKSTSQRTKTSGFNFEQFDRRWRQGIQSRFLLEDPDIEAIRPCTAVQTGMLSQTLNSSGKLYINHVTYQIPESVSAADLQAAWKLVCERHQVLRLGFHRLESSSHPFIMVVQPPGMVSLPLAEERGEITIDAIETRAAETIVRSNLSRPWQVTLQRNGDKRLMILSLHHALYDAQSLNIILSDLAKVLSSERLQSPSNFDKLLGVILASDADGGDSSAIFWKNTLQLAAFSKFPDLTPTVVEDGPFQSNRVISSKPLSSIEHFCRSSDVTIQSLGQTIWAKLLAEYTGEENVTFGTVLSTRSSATDEYVAFPGISTIPVTCNTSSSNSDILQNMMAFNASVQKHRFTPLAEIQRYAGRPMHPLFDTVFVYQKLACQRKQLDWPLVKETAAVDYRVSLELESSPNDEMKIILTYDTNYVPAEHASVMLRQYDHLLSLLVDGDIRQANFSDPMWSKLPAKDPYLPSHMQLLHHRLERTAALHPDRPALHFVYGSRAEKVYSKTWTYKQLDDTSNQFAHLIRQLKIPLGSVIAVSMDKCPEASFAFVGILKAGCSFLAIDPALPENRLNFILEDSDARLLFGDQPKPPVSLNDGVRYVDLTASPYAMLPTSTIEDHHTAPSSTCYCLYTSGTTGTPKGCEITHENALQFNLAFDRLFAGRWNENSRFLQFASYWFDVSVMEQFWSWGVGFAVVGASRDLVLEDLPGFIQDFEITHIDLTPSLARLVHPDDVPSLWNGVFITGGEALRQEIIDAWGPKKVICNGYGPTETTIGNTINCFIGPDAKPSNIGPQYDNVGTYVLRPGSEEIVMRGAVGELCVSGVLLGKGYLNRAELTEKAFPFLEQDEERIYRTGDLVRMLSDGSFAFIGRKDTQTKLRGQRLEIGEIDSVIQRSGSEINNVASLVIKSADGAKEILVSFITTTTSGNAKEPVLEVSEDAHLLVKAAKNACVRSLPGYMIPTHILVISHLPLTVNNKLHTKRLQALFDSISMKDLLALQGSEISSEALSEVEQKIRSALCEVVPGIAGDYSKSTNIFSLGLSSISAISLSSQLKGAGFKNASPARIMQNPTLELLGEALSSTSNQQDSDVSFKQSELYMTAFTHRYLHSAASSLSVPVDAIEAVAPCTALQQGMILDSIRGNTASYFNVFRYDISCVDVDILKSAWQTLVNGVQTLRTRFIDTEDGHIQVILRHQQFQIVEHETDEAALDSIAQEAKKCWVNGNIAELTNPLQVHFIKTKAKCFMVVLIHHSLYDGISFGLILQRLAQIYNSKRPYDFGPTFTTALSSGLLHSPPGAQKFWTERLHASRHVLVNKPSDKAEGSSILLSFGLGNVNKLESTRKALGVSHQAILQSCFEFCLWQSHAQIRSYGLVVSGRSIDLHGADRIIGPMFNTLPYRLEVQAGANIKDHIQRCQRLNVEALPFQHTPLRSVRKWCGLHPTDPMFEVIFIFQHRQYQQLSEATNLFSALETTSRADYPLECEITLTDEGSLDATFVAQDVKFEREALERLRTSLQEAFQCVCTNYNDRIGDRFEVPASDDPTEESERKNNSPTTNGGHHFEWAEGSKEIRSILSELSGVDTTDIDEHTSMFALGLDSIDAVKFASRLRRVGYTIPVSHLLQAQTIPRMLQACGRPADSRNSENDVQILQRLQQQLSNVKILDALEMASIERILPATPNQEAVLAPMIRTELRQYFNHDVLRLRPSTNLNKLKSAWQSVVELTPILRTSFIEIADPDIAAVFAQVVHSNTAVHFDEYECKDIEDSDNIFEKIRRDVLLQSQCKPLLRLTIITILFEKYLVLSLPHAQYDGHSLAMLHQDVLCAYHAQLPSRPSYDHAIGEALRPFQEDTRSYWNGLIAGAIPAPLPKPTGAADDSVTHRNYTTCEVSASEAQAFCQRQGISMQALAETSWAITLAQLTGCFDVLFGVVLACRDSEEAQQMAFPLMNTVVMRSSLHGSRSQMLHYMQGIITERSLYQRTPLRAIQAAAQKAETSGFTSGNPLFDTLFIYQKRPDEVEGVAPLYDSIGGSSNVEYPVAVEMEAMGQNLIIRAACKDTAFEAAGTETLLETMDKVVKGIVSSPDQPTVEFAGNKASICGLDRFTVQTPQKASHDIAPSPGTPDGYMDSETSINTAKITAVLAEVSRLSTEDITPNSTTESIGIDSISAIKVAALLRKQSIHLSVSEIVRAKTPARMASIVDSRATTQESTTDRPASEIIATAVQKFNHPHLAAILNTEVDNIDTVLPATAGQIYMLSMWLKTKVDLMYPTFEFQLNTAMSLDRMYQTWGVLVDRHPILRTVFCASGDADMSVLQVVLRDAPENNGGRGAQSMVSLNVERNEEGCLLRITIHHALYDAVSLPLLMQDFQSLLSRSSEPLTKLKFEDFIAVSLIPSAIDAQKAFWTEYLQPANQLRLSQPLIDASRGRVEIFQPALFPDMSKLESRARSEGVSVQDLLFAAYAKVYAVLAQKSVSAQTDSQAPRDVVLGIYLSNRSHIAGLDTLPAPTLNLVPLRVRGVQEKSILELVKQIHVDLQEIANPVNSAVSLLKAHEWTGVAIDTFVNFLKLPEAEDQEGESKVVVKSLDHRRMQQRRGVVEIQSSTVEVPAALKELHVGDAYQLAIDIEMVAVDGKLGVGFFAPKRMVALEEADAALQEFNKLLKNFVVTPQGED